VVNPSDKPGVNRPLYGQDVDVVPPDAVFYMAQVRIDPPVSAAVQTPDFVELP